MGEYTHHISVEDLFREYKNNPEYREVLNSGNFAHVEDCIVINHEKYVEKDDNGRLRSTEYARDNLQECALQFELVPADKMCGE